MADITAFCAVWHRNPDRHALLASHRENLRRQTVPVRPIYVFDGGDTPPDGLDAEVICSNEPLTIYQAWNLALARVGTPLVMNLNLDDRLATDAAEQLALGLKRGNAHLAGGDWRICYSQAETDLVGDCFPAQALARTPAWPPEPGRAARIGCSDNVPSHGPATLWRMDVHATLPRYPWRFGDGSPIRAIADALFWQLLKMNNFSLVRLPLVIGNYHSHPAEQAEFRVDNKVEWQLAGRLGVERY